jgi:hypothetical protein
MLLLFRGNLGSVAPGPAVLSYEQLHPRPSCPTARLPAVRGLRIATHAAQEPGVAFLSWQRFREAGRELPPPVMSSAAALERSCGRYRPSNPKQYGFCARSPPYFKERYKCESASYVATVDCAFIDPDTEQHSRPGLVYTHRQAYAVHLSSGHWGRVITPPSRARLHSFPELAHALGVYPTAPAHDVERLPRLLHLLTVLPPHVPILLARAPLVEQFLAILDAMARAGCALRGGGCSGAQLVRLPSGDHAPLADVLAALPSKPAAAGNLSSRAVWWQGTHTYSARRVFFAAESVFVRERMGAENPHMPDPERGWYDLLDEAPCHYKRIQSSWRLQRALVPAFTRPANSSRGGGGDDLRVLLVHRAETNMRRVRNQAQLEAGLRRALPRARLSTFVGRDHSLAATISLFAHADLVVAPHGAACAFWAFMRPHAAVIEIGYPSTAIMGFPASFYYPFAASLQLRYHLSFAVEGGYTSPMVADVVDVASLAVSAAQWLRERERHVQKYRRG